MGIDARRASNVVRQRIAKELKFLDASVALQEAIWIMGGCRNMKPVSRTAIDLKPEVKAIVAAGDATPRRGLSQVLLRPASPEEEGSVTS